MAPVVADEPVLATPEAALDLDEHFEIIDGQRVELPPMSAYTSRIASRLGYKLNEFAQAHALGEAVTETIFRLPLPVGRNRRPDVAMVSYQRWPKGKLMPYKDNAWDVVPELAVEVISPSDLADEILEKIEEFFRAGVLLVWVVFPRQGLVYVYESEGKIQVFTRADELDGGAILPGFRLPLTALFVEEPSAQGAGP